MAAERRFPNRRQGARQGAWESAAPSRAPGPKRGSTLAEKNRDATYDKIGQKKSGRREKDPHVRSCIRNELALKKSTPPTGPGAATVDRGKPRMCAALPGRRTKNAPEDETDLMPRSVFCFQNLRRDKLLQRTSRIMNA